MTDYYNATFGPPYQQTVPTQINDNSVDVPVSVTVRNVGNTVWYPRGFAGEIGCQLGLQIQESDDPDEPIPTDPWGVTRLDLPYPIAQGAAYQFNFTINPNMPASADPYDFRWQMIQDGGVGWFGGLSAETHIVVYRGQ